MSRSVKFSALSAAFGALALVACADVSRDELMNGAGAAQERRSQPIDADDSDDQPSSPQGTGTGQGSGDDSTDSDDVPSNPSNPSSQDAGSTDPDTDPDDGANTFAETVLARAKQWVDVKMPYCGGVNGGSDLLCGGTCVRTGVHASPEWDPYRTDCSGFVSWSWSLPAPGRITTWFAPYFEQMEPNTKVINVDDLLPGDALNNRTHIILFGGWANDDRTQARLLEEYDCGQVAVDRIRSISKVSDTEVQVPSGRFFAIRLNSRPN